MKMQLLFLDNHTVSTIDTKEIIRQCGSDYTEFEILRVIYKMKAEKEIEILIRKVVNK